MKNGDTRPKQELPALRLGVCWYCRQRRWLAYRLRRGRFTLPGVRPTGDGIRVWCRTGARVVRSLVPGIGSPPIRIALTLSEGREPMSRDTRIQTSSVVLLISAAAACGGGDSVGPQPAPPPLPPANRAPAVTGTIPDQTVIEGQTVTVDISGAFSDPDDDALSYAATTSNASVATIGVSGTDLSVTGVSAGASSVTVTASDPSGLSAAQSFAVNVDAAAPTTMRITPEADTLTAIDQTLQLSAEVLDQLGRTISDATVTWASGDAAVVIVDTAGLVTAVGPGETTVTGTTGDASASSRLTVDQVVQSITVSPDDETIETGESLQFMASAFDENDHPVDDASFGWTSSDTAVARVDSTGLVLGLAEGTATIIAATGDVVGTASITVVPPPDMWRGIVVAAEDRCTTYNADDYRHSAAVEAEIVTAMGGRIYEPYRGVYFDDTRATDIEHVIAKSEAHESGGCAWTRDERRAFANDLANLTLSAPRLNRFVKSNNDAAEWLPPLNQCWYAGTIVAVRVKYGLTVDEAERDTLEAILANCDSAEMVFTSQEWEIEAITLGDESGWQAVSPNALDIFGVGIVSKLAVFCTPTFVSADFDFISGGGRLEGSVLNVPISRPRYTSNVSTTWLVPLNPPLRTITVHQYPHWETWTARVDADQRTDFIVGLAVPSQAASIVWPLPVGSGTVVYEGGTDVGEKILEILERCTAGNDANVAAVLSELAAGNAEAKRELPRRR